MRRVKFCRAAVELTLRGKLALDSDTEVIVMAAAVISS